MHMSPGNAPAVPILETPRLRLRAHRPSDLPQCAAMWADPAVTRFIGGEPCSEQRTWARLLAYIGHWTAMGFGYWLMEERGSGDFVGEVGLADFRRDIASSMKGCPELGFALASRFHRKGYATEGAEAVVAWADSNLPFARTVCLIDPENRASLRVAGKCGYQVFERGVYGGRPAMFLERPARLNSAASAPAAGPGM